MPDHTFAEMLRRQRDVAGLTQAELAARAGVAVRTVSNLERGVNSGPYAVTVRRLSAALALPDPARAELMAAARSVRSRPSREPPSSGSYLGAAPASDLVGRATERTALLRAVSAAAAGATQALLLTGEPGIGKTRLAQEAFVMAAQEGFVVAAGRCYEPTSRTPFAPFLEAMATLYAAAPLETRTRFAQRWPSITPLLPDEFPASTADIAPAPVEAERLHRALAGFVRELSSHRPVALLFDDLQWADSASLGLLTHLVRHLGGQRVLLLATSRNVGVTPTEAVRELARSLRHEGLLATIAVGRLDRNGTTALLMSRLDDAPMSPEFVTLLHDLAQGNPFYTVEILMALIDRGDLSRVDGRWVRREVSDLGAPASIGDVINERVARLSTRTQEVLHAVSVLGEVLQVDDLVILESDEAHEADEATLEAALDEAAAAGLLSVADNGYVFDHVLTHQALYAALSPLRRRKLHRVVGERLDTVSEPMRRRRAAEIARHLEAGGATDRAVVHLLVAGDTASEIHALAEAVLHYQHAAALAEEVDDDDGVADAHERTGRVMIAGGHYEEAIPHLDRAAVAYRQTGNRSARLRIEGMIAQAQFGRGSGESAAARLSRVLAELDRPLDGDGDDRIEAVGIAVLSNGLARVRLALRDHAGAVDAAGRGAQLARRHDAGAVEADAEAIRGVSLIFVDRPDEATAVLEYAASLAASVKATVAERDALLGLQYQCTIRGDFHRAQTAAHRGLELTDGAWDTDARALQTATLGLTMFYRGDWAAANARLEESVRLGASDSGTLFSGIPPAYLGLLRRGQGDLAAAESCYREALAAPDLLTFGFDAYLDARLTELDLLRGEPAAGLRRLERWLPLDTRSRPHDVMLLCIAAEACFDLGDHERGAELADQAVARAKATSNEVEGLDALRLQAAGLAQRGRTVEARSLAEEALSRARTLPYPAAEARLHRQLARLAAADGQQAQEHLDAARELFTRLGAAWDAAETAARSFKTRS